MSEPQEARVRAMVRQALRRYLRADATEEIAANNKGALVPRPSTTSRAIIDEERIASLTEGSRFAVPAGALVTPLARDAARARRIQLVEEATGVQQPAARVGAGTKRRIAIGADHGGVELKSIVVAHLQGEGFEVVDLGPFDKNSVDYPDYAYAVAKLVSDGSVEAGIMIDGVGIGSAMAANKVPGVRASLCYDTSTARNAREHNHANYLTLGGQLIGPLLAKQIVSTWLATPFGPGRHANRVEKIMEIERRYTRRPSAAE